jgi:citryl-CoA lyase
MQFKTAISKIGEDDLIIQGEKLSNLIEASSFTDAAFLLLNKRKPNDVESKLFASMLTAVIDHGMGTTSSMTTRFVMSGGNTLNAAVAGGVLALGDYHGGAIENCMKQLQEASEDPDAFVSSIFDNKKIIFGFGHKHYKEADPRTGRILALCEKLSYTSKYLDTVKKIGQLIEEKKGKKLCLNIDGIMSAILLEMGFPPGVGKGIFIIARTPGLVAQALEEKECEKPVRRVPESEIEYLG